MNQTWKIVLIILSISTCGIPIAILATGIIAVTSAPAILNNQQNPAGIEARRLARSLASAQYAYFAANGHYAGSLEELEQPVAYIDAKLVQENVEQGMSVKMTGDGRSFTGTVITSHPTRIYTIDETGAITHN